MEIFGFAITFFSLVIAYQAWQNGRFMKEELKAVRELLAKMDEHIMKMDEQAEKRHREVVEIINSQHQNVVELLKKGFGDLTRDIEELKNGSKSMGDK
ncbi:MAG: hypothetical protein DRI36_05040 [Caldiserica bacterium]|nr:MAG: hypothetical protein DRI36_05040 [Caldisericota bacterium]